MASLVRLEAKYPISDKDGSPAMEDFPCLNDFSIEAMPIDRGIINKIRSDVRIKQHKIQGIGDGFIPKLIDMKKVDKVITVGSEEAIQMAKKLSKKYGLLVGISAGANMLSALKVAKHYKKVVTVLPDRGERYLSMNLFKN